MSEPKRSVYLPVLLAVLAGTAIYGSATASNPAENVSATSNTSDPNPSLSADEQNSTDLAISWVLIRELRSDLQQQQQLSGPDSPDLIPILDSLSQAELEAGESEYAAARLEQIVNLIRDTNSFYSPDLLIPLLRLAVIYMNTGRFEQAIERLRYAQHLTHRNDGVYSLDQLEIIEKLAQSFLNANDLDEADREKRLAHNLSARVHGEETIEHVPGMLRYAAWHRFLGRDRKARNLYFRAIEMLETKYGPDHYSLIEPLTQLSRTASESFYYIKDREAALLRADDILNKQPGVDAGDRAASAIGIATFYTKLNKPENAKEHYARAWKILEDNDDSRLSNERIFGQPVVLNFPHTVIPQTNWALLLRPQEIEVTYEFKVGADGAVTDVKVVDHTGPIALTRSLRKVAFALRYRPRMANGEPVTTENFRVTEKLMVGSTLTDSQKIDSLMKEIIRIRQMLIVRDQRRTPSPRARRRARPRTGP